MTTDLIGISLSEKQFNYVRNMIYRIAGIKLQSGKEEMVKARLMKRLRVLGISSYEKYLDFVEKDTSKTELTHLVDVLTTNKTDFFREQQHFDFLSQQIIPKLDKHGKFRIWSAGCSSGEEPYTIAMLLREELPNVDMYDIRILATDVSSRMVERVRQAQYDKKTLNDVAPLYRNKYFISPNGKSEGSYRIRDDVRNMVRVARLNLMQPWPMQGPFDIIFCRNVMIYFDKETQEKLINRYWEMLPPGGYLFVGHSESMAGISHKFQYVQPAVYIK